MTAIFMVRKGQEGHQGHKGRKAPLSLVSLKSFSSFGVALPSRLAVAVPPRALLGGEQHHGDVVDAAAGVGVVDEGAADLVQAAAGGQAVADVGLGGHAGQAVSAQQEEASVL